MHYTYITPQVYSNYKCIRTTCINSSGYSALANNAYLSRHIPVAKIVHIQLALKHKLLHHITNIIQKQFLYLLISSFTESSNYYTQTFDHNSPDLLLIDKEQKTAYIYWYLLTTNLKKQFTFIFHHRPSYYFFYVSVLQAFRCYNNIINRSCGCLNSNCQLPKPGDRSDFNTHKTQIGRAHV